jgi:hypothetical protein
MQTAGRAWEGFSREMSVIRRAAFQKSRSMPIFMKKQRNFDWAAGFCPFVLSARFV